MKPNRLLTFAIIITTINLFCVILIKKHNRIIAVPAPIAFREEIKFPNAKIQIVNPGYLNYVQTNQQLRKWEEEAKDLVDIGNYGSSTNGQLLTYVKITNELDKKPKPKILIMACIHANECLAACVAMNYIGCLLDEYNNNKEIANILNTKEIWFIPICSPDSFPNTRGVDGVDPNRDFMNKRSPIVRAIQNLHLKENFVSVASLHTFGRMYLIPWGENTQFIPEYEVYKKIVGQMAEKSNYKLLRACEIYGSPIYGGELDWFYKNKAFSIVVELGTHQKIPKKEEIEYEKNRTWEAFILFLTFYPHNTT